MHITGERICHVSTCERTECREADACQRRALRLGPFSDAERMDWLERQANEPGGLLLHDGDVTGHRGLGLRPGSLNRTLREAIDAAMRGDSQGGPNG